MKEKKKKSIFKKWWFWVVVVLLLGGIGSTMDESVANVSKESFSKLKKGMTYDEVKRIVGGSAKEEKINQFDSNIVEYVFDGEDNTKVSLLFVREKLDYKSGFDEVTETVAKLEGETKKPEKELTKEEIIQKAVEVIINEDLKNTSIKQLMVNENLGVDDGSFIVLPHLKWDVKNSAKTTKEILEMYSDHLAAKLADYEVSDVTVFWEVPHHLEGNNIAKFNYQKTPNGMAIGERWYDQVIK